MLSDERLQEIYWSGVQASVERNRPDVDASAEHSDGLRAVAQFALEEASNAWQQEVNDHTGGWGSHAATDFLRARAASISTDKAGTGQ